MFTATVRNTGSEFKAIVDYEKETCHSNSLHRQESSIIDDRVPPELYLSCNKKGQVAVYSERPKSPSKEVAELKTRRAGIVEQSGVIFVVPQSTGVDVQWPSNWLRIKCVSKAHAEIVLDKMKESATGWVSGNSEVQLV